MITEKRYPTDPEQMRRLVQYNLILSWLKTIEDRNLINLNEYIKAIQETEKLYSDVKDWPKIINKTE